MSIVRCLFQIGTDEQHAYPNADGQTVRWIFVGLEQLDELAPRTIQDGTEIWSELVTSPDPLGRVLSRDELVG